MSQSATELELLRSMCETLGDSESQARAECKKAQHELEGIPPNSRYPLSFLQSFFWMTLTSHADFRKKTFAQYEFFKLEIETLQTLLEELRKAADPVLQLAFPEG